jgi:hypothetical protein
MGSRAKAMKAGRQVLMRRTSFALAFLVVAEATIGSGERRPFPYEQPWSGQCAQIAAKVPRIGGDIEAPIAIRRFEPIDLKKWDLRCPDVFPMFELIVTETGKVRCARIIHLTRAKPPDGLYDEVRSNLLKMTFKPATVRGKPIQVIGFMSIAYKCA